MKSSIRSLIEVGNDQEAASDQFTADPKSLSDCGHACHTAVKAKDYIFQAVPEALNRRCPDSKKDVPVRGLIFDLDTSLLWEVQPIAQQAAA